MNKNQEEHLKRQVSTLRNKCKQYEAGVTELRTTFNLMMAQMALTFGEEREGGYRLEFPVPKLDLLEKYEATYDKLEDKYVIGLIERMDGEQE